MREKVEGGDPWGLDEVESEEEPEWKVKGGELVKNAEKDKGRKKSLNRTNKSEPQVNTENKLKNEKREHSTSISIVKNEILPTTILDS